MKQLVYLIPMFLTACEGIVGGDGTVIEKVSKEPIEGVQVILYLDGHPHDTSISDSLGQFRGSEFVGCVPDCPKATIKLTKPRYKSKVIDFEEFWKENAFDPSLRDNLTVEMEGS